MKKIMALFLISALIAMGCTQNGGSKATPTAMIGATATLAAPSEQPSITENPVGMVNPAAAHCTQLGFQDKIITNTDGSQSGQCVFTDGTTCDDWAFYRGSCGQQFSACAQNNGTLVETTENVNDYQGDYGLCTFSDGTQCSEDQLAAGACQEGQCKHWSIQNGCQSTNANATANAQSASPTSAQLANPASLHCTSLNFQENETDSGTMCVFSDGTSCEEWAFSRGTCGQSFSACTKSGGILQSKTERIGGTIYEYGLCTFSDGSQCGENEISQNTCKSGMCKAWTGRGCQTS